MKILALETSAKAVSAAVSENGKILSKLSNEDSFMTRDSFAGALCSSKIRYTIEIKYCSFSRSNELRFLVGDIVKYAENKIRAYLNIKSRLTVYSMPMDLKEKIDSYFALNLSGHRSRTEKEEKHDYDVLYELPIKPLSLENALKIEESSWETTNELIDAFEEDDKFCEITQSNTAFEVKQIPNVIEKSDDAIDLKTRLGDYLPWISAIDNNDLLSLKALTEKTGKMLDSIIDEINEIAVDVIGDILIEEDGNDGYTIIACYREMIV